MHYSCWRRNNRADRMPARQCGKPCLFCCSSRNQLKDCTNSGNTPRQGSGGRLGNHYCCCTNNEPFAGAALLASPKQASAIPARPAPNFFNACRRVTDWANPLASSSNLLFMTFSFVFCFSCVVGAHL